MGLTYVNQVGAVEGINQAAPGAFIPDTSVRWAQDILFDRVGYLRRRPPFKIFDLYNSTPPITVTQPSTPNERVVSVVSTLNPDGDRILGLVLTTASSSRILFYDEDFRQVGVANLPAPYFPIDVVSDCKQASTGGMWLSFMESYKTDNTYWQYFWYGGHGTEVDISGVSLDYIVESQAKHNTYTNTLSKANGFTTANITPGMFVFVNYSGADYYIGMVSDKTNSQITLEKDIIRFIPDTAIGTATYTVKFRNVRPYMHTHGRGLITRETTGTTVVSGSVGTEGEGHFRSAELQATNTIQWALYRASDGEWIGDVNTVTSNAALTLDNDHHSLQPNSLMRADEYIAWPYAISDRDMNASFTGNTIDATKFAGIFNATYTGLQWYGNAGSSATANRLVFSAPHSAEAVDLSRDASDSIMIPSTAEMRGLASSSSGLLIFTADKTYILRGNYRANFSLEELYPEGCLSAMSVVEYGGGVFWSSRVGIMFFDGATVRNLVQDNLGSYYTDSIRTFNVNADRIYSFIHKDYLFVHFTAFDSAFKPERYEPIYAEGIVTTPATQAFSYTDVATVFNVTNKVLTNNQATLTLGEHSLNQDDTILVSINDEAFDGIFTIDSVTQTQITYTSVADNVTSTAASGTVTLQFDDTPVWDDDFAPEDFTVESNVPVYWDPVQLYDSTATTTTRVVPIWQNVGDTAYYWDNNNTQNVWGPVRLSDGITFAIYLPTGAITTLSNFDFRTATVIDTIRGIRGLMGVNIVYGDNDIRPRLVDVDSILETNESHIVSEDAALIENLGKSADTYIKGPDFFLQTKHYTVGDPVLKKWFRTIMMNLSLLDGAVRMDVLDMEDNDHINISKKRHKNWEIFGAVGYSWNEWENVIAPKLSSPNLNTWGTLQNFNKSWYDLTDAEFTRRTKKISWRYPSAGFRLYQMNKYRPSNYQMAQKPYSILIDSWNIGFKPMRKSRV